MHSAPIPRDAFCTILRADTEPADETGWRACRKHGSKGGGWEGLRKGLSMSTETNMTGTAPTEPSTL
eukprot:2838491-Alexandrium_andersonii.AAC.1